MYMKEIGGGSDIITMEPASSAGDPPWKASYWPPKYVIQIIIPIDWSSHGIVDFRVVWVPVVSGSDH